MHRSTRFFLGVFLLAAAFGISPFFIPPAIAQSPPAESETIPDLDALIRDMREKGPRCMEQWGDFTQTMTVTYQKFDMDGKVKSRSQRTYEVFVPEFILYRRKGSFDVPVLLVAQDGVPVPPDKQEKERKKATRDLEKFAQEFDESKRESNKTGKEKTGSTFQVSPRERTKYFIYNSMFGGTNVLSPSDIFFYADFGAARRETLDGRETVVVEFRVRPDWKFDKSMRYVGQLEGLVWIDVRDRTLVRLEGWQRTPGKGEAFLSNPRPAKAPVLYEQVRVADGIWFPSRHWLFADATTTMFNSFKNTEVMVEHSNYRRFRSQVIVMDEEEKK